jgi:hypothetical protein
MWSRGSVICTWPEPALHSASATLVVKSRLGPDRDARNTIEAHRRAARVDNHRDHDNHDRRDENRAHHYED